MVVAELLAIGSAAASFISATASAALDIAQTIFLLLAKMVDWTLQATQQLFTFESQQPLAFTLIFGTALVIFVALPFVTGVNYNSLLFGSTETVYEERPGTPQTIANFTDAELADMINNLHLAQLEDVPKVQVLMQQTNRDAFLGTSNFAAKLFPTTTTLMQQEAQFLVTGATLPEIQESWRNTRYETCGKLSNKSANTSTWELEIKPINPDLVMQFQQAAANANLRFYNVTLSCYQAQLNASTEMAVPGSTKEAQVYNLHQLIDNGSICDDVSLGGLASVQPQSHSTSPVPIISILGSYFNIISSLWRHTTTAPVENNTNCYIIVRNSSRERMYTNTPFWLTNTPGANITVQFFYQDLVLKDTRLSTEEAAALKVIGFPVTTNSTVGLLDIPTGSYRVLKDTTVAATGGATASMFDWFEVGITILALLILGTAGVIMVYNISRINR